MELPESETKSVAEANGWIVFCKTIADAQFITLSNLTSGNIADVETSSGTQTPTISIPVAKGDIYQVTYTGTGEFPIFRFVFAKGNGDLYYFMGEAVNNAHLVNVANITAELSNKIGPQSDKLEGHFVATPSLTIAESQAIDNTTKIFDISEYLPQDGYEYLVWVTGAISTTATNGKYTNLHVGSDLMNSTYCTLCGTTARSAYSYIAYGSACIPVGKDRQIWRYGNTSGSGTYTISLKGYRRMGN